MVVARWAAEIGIPGFTKAKIRTDEKVECSITITNTGNVTIPTKAAVLWYYYTKNLGTITGTWENVDIAWDEAVKKKGGIDFFGGNTRPIDPGSTYTYEIKNPAVNIPKGKVDAGFILTLDTDGDGTVDTYADCLLVKDAFEVVAPPPSVRPPALPPPVKPPVKPPMPPVRPPAPPPPVKPPVRPPVRPPAPPPPVKPPVRPPVRPPDLLPAPPPYPPLPRFLVKPPVAAPPVTPPAAPPVKPPVAAPPVTPPAAPPVKPPVVPKLTCRDLLPAPPPYPPLPRFLVERLIGRKI